MPIGCYENDEIRRLRNKRRVGADGREADIARIAELQGGQIHRLQLRALGLSARAIDYRVAAGRLHCRHRQVYGVGHPRDDLEAMLHAAVLMSGDASALSHHAAAVHLGIVAGSVGTIDLTIPGQLRAREGLRFHRRALPFDEVEVAGGLPVTCAARTLFDLAGTLPEWQFRRAVKEVEVQSIHSPLSFVDLLERHPHPPGAAVIRAITTERAAPATLVPSDGEDRFAALVAAAGLPQPSHRYGIALANEWVEVDYAWPELRVAVEVDSSFHEVDTARETDHLRDQALMAEGWWVFRVTWRQLCFEPSAVLFRLRRLLKRAEADRLLRERHIWGVA